MSNILGFKSKYSSSINIKTFLIYNMSILCSGCRVVIPTTDQILAAEIREECGIIVQ
jgi:hypothetical protein